MIDDGEHTDESANKTATATSVQSQHLLAELAKQTEVSQHLIALRAPFAERSATDQEILQRKAETERTTTTQRVTRQMLRSLCRSKSEQRLRAVGD